MSTPMPMRAYGGGVLRVPVLGFGAMQVGDPALDEMAAAHMLHHVLDAGLALIDTARSYGVAEERIGRHLATRRDEFVLSTKVGYGVPGVPDWTYDCVVAGVDAARGRLRSDVIDIVHLHSCPLAVLREGAVVDALHECVRRGWIRVAAYSGDDAALQFAVDSGAFRGVQASVSVSDQRGLATLTVATDRGVGTIAKRPLAGRPWAAAGPADTVHDEYRHRFAVVRSMLDFAPADWDACALRFAAWSRGVDCVIAGGIDPAHVDRNVAAVLAGPLEADVADALRAAFARGDDGWTGLV
jgi:aryl-alcohol dehydrogenase-like predicted oxidoreductase